jgi:5-methylcytosine-specific restriction endonuclease McrA
VRNEASPAQRERLFSRCQGLCEICGKPPDWRGLAIHHKRPKGMGGTRMKYTDDMLMVVCGVCHSVAHHLREGRRG